MVVVVVVVGLRVLFRKILSRHTLYDMQREGRRSHDYELKIQGVQRRLFRI